MKQEIAIKWVAALRSGKYKQTDTYLRDEKGFCCLGVLCEEIGINGKSVLNEKRPNVFRYGQELQECGLPREAKEISGIKTSLADLPCGDDQIIVTTLAHLNDNGKTFLEIADIIEEKWEEL